MQLRDYLSIIRAHWLGIVVCVVVGLLGSVAVIILQPRVYTATSTGYVTALTPPAGSTAADIAQTTNDALVGAQLAQQAVPSFVDVGTWRSVADYAISELNLHTTAEKLLENVKVSSPLNTVIIQVSANAGSPTASRDLAETWIKGMQKQITALQTNQGKGIAAVSLTHGDSAQLPTSPSSPSTALYLFVGLLAGLVVGLAYAFGRHVLDRRVRDPRAIEKQTGTTVVGTIPVAKELNAHRVAFAFSGGTQAFTPTIEAMRELRTNLQYMNVDNPPRVIVVTSPLPGDGKSVTAGNLAMSLAAAGEHVILIDADLRRPVVAQVFGLPEGAGLTDVLAGRSTVADIAHVPYPDGNLVVFTAGRVPPNPSEVLGSQRMRDLLHELSLQAIVVIDSPPTIPVTDAAVLSTLADGVLMVVSAGRTTYDMLQKALANIRRAKGNVLGVVLNKVPTRGAKSTYYGYRYKGRYGEFEGDAKAEPAQPPETDGPVPAVDDVFAHKETVAAPTGGRRARRATTPAAPVAEPGVSVVE